MSELAEIFSLNTCLERGGTIKLRSGLKQMNPVGKQPKFFSLTVSISHLLL